MHKGPGDGLTIRNVAHRGASGRAPENTVAAFEQAIADGADYVECDVQRTCDGHLVVIHDPTLERLAGVPARVGALPLADLRAIDVGRWFGPEFSGERVPTLTDVISGVRGRCRLSLEIKFGGMRYPGIEAQVVETLRREGLMAETILSSFNFDAIEEVRRLEPRARTGLIFWGASRDLVPIAERLGCEMLSLEQEYVTEEVVATAARRGLWVNVFTVDRVEEIARCVAVGVGAISSNFPDRVAAALRNVPRR